MIYNIHETTEILARDIKVFLTLTLCIYLGGNVSRGVRFYAGK